MARRGNQRQTVLRFDSQFRTGGTNNEPIFHLEQRLVNVSMVELRKVIIPNTDYPVNESTCTINWIDSQGLVVNGTKLALGNFTAAEYIINIADSLTTDDSGGAVYTGAIIVDFLAKFTIISDIGNFTFTGGTFFNMSGFEAGQVSAGMNMFAANVFDASGPNYVLLRSPNLVNGSSDFSHFSGKRNGSTNTTNVLEAVYKSSDFGISILTDYNTKLRQSFHGILSVIELQLSYPEGAVVDLNGRPWLVEMRVRHSR